MLVYFSSFNDYTIDSKLIDLACYFSFLVHILRTTLRRSSSKWVWNFESVFFSMISIKVPLQSCQGSFHLLLCLTFLLFLLGFMEFLVQLPLNDNKFGIIPFPFLLMGFKFKRINARFCMLLFIHDYSLQVFHFWKKLLNYFAIRSFHICHLLS